MREEDDLPEGWHRTTVAALATATDQPVLTGPFGSHLGREDFRASGVPVLTIGCLQESGLTLAKALFIEEAKARELVRYQLKAGDILFSRMASVGRAAVVDKRFAGAIINYHLMRLRLDAAKYLPDLFVAYVQGAPEVRLFLDDMNHGATRDGINTTQLLAMPVAAPPLDEQRRIVAKLDALRARSRRAKEALDAVPALIDRLRQSILAAAFRGDLTADWREQNPDVEPASELLKRIRIERRKRWEEAELAKMVAKGKPPKDDRWKAKYVEPDPVDATDLPDLPDTWCWASVETLGDLEWGNTGLTKASYVDSGVCAFSASGPDGYVDIADRSGDGIVIAAIGARCGRTFRASGEWTAIKNTMTLTSIAQGVDVDAVRLFLDDEHVWPKRGGAQPFIALADARRVLVPLAPTMEQRVLVGLLGQAQRWFEASRHRVSSAGTHIGDLDSAILAAAFRGELLDRDADPSG